MALVLLAGLQTIPRSLYEAAEIDGAGRWQQFVEITLPMLRPAIVVALIFRTITAIQTFDIPYAMTGGGPGDSTETLAMYIHKTTIDFLDFGYGSALAALMFVVSIVVTSGYLRYTRRDPGRERGAEMKHGLPTTQRWSGSLALIVAAQRLLSRRLDPAHLAQDRDRADAHARSPIYRMRRRSQNYVPRLHRPADPALPVEQLRRGDAFDVLCVFVSALAAYALGAPAHASANLIMSVLLAVAMFPLISLMVPLFQMMRELGLLNT